MGALEAFEIFDDVLSLLSEELPALTPLVLGIDSTCLFQGFERVRIFSLIELYPPVEFQSGGRLGIFPQRLRSELFCTGDLPSIEQILALLKWWINFGAIQVERRNRDDE